MQSTALLVLAAALVILGIAGTVLPLLPGILLVFAGLFLAAPAFVHCADPADLIVHKAKVVTVDAKFSIAQAVAVRDGRVIAVGTDAEVMKLQGPNTKLIDAGGKMVLPGLYDSHVHPSGVVSSEIGDPMPLLRSIPEVQEYIKHRL